MNYLILSRGAYSDYSPDYYVGEKKITEKELNEKAKEFSLKTYDWYDNLPTKEHKHDIWCYSNCKKVKDVVYPDGMRSLADYFWQQMENWVKEMGYKKLPDDIPEINISYGDLPFERK